jgi:hypothetical protein
VAIYRYDLQTQAVYSELVERLQLAEIQELAEQEGSFVKRRANTSSDKARKDIAQAETLIEALLKDHPDDLMDAWSDLTGRGRKWKIEAMKSVRNLPKPIQEALTGKVVPNS